MQTGRGVQVLLITGPPAVGKSSAAELLSDLLAEAGVGHAVVDLDELDRRGALAGPDLHFENLAAVWRNYAVAGVPRLVLAWTLDSAAELERLSRAVPGARITVCRLRADPATVVARAARRETPSMREQLQALALKYASRMERERPGDIVIETQGRPLSEVALELGRVSGWLSAEAREHIPLIGGRLTGGVVRVGGTVRRPLKDRSPYVHELLRYLEGVGFGGAPRCLRVDEHGREVLSFIDGWVPAELDRWADEQLTDAATLLRRYHDATAESPLAEGHEVVCHNDPSPCNFVFQGGRPRAMIDFDQAGPGARLDDLAYACWLWTLTSDEDGPVAAEQARQLRLFADAYGIEYRPVLIDAIQRRQRENLQAAVRRTYSTDPATAAYARSSCAWQRREIAWVAANRGALGGMLRE